MEGLPLLPHELLVGGMFENAAQSDGRAWGGDGDSTGVISVKAESGIEEQREFDSRTVPVLRPCGGRQTLYVQLSGGPAGRGCDNTLYVPPAALVGVARVPALALPWSVGSVAPTRATSAPP